MKATTYYGIDAHWWADHESPAKLSARFLDMLDKLGPISPAMSHWQLMDFVDLVERPLTEVRAEITGLVSKNAILDDDGQIDPRNGYNLWARRSRPSSPHRDRLSSRSMAVLNGTTMPPSTSAARFARKTPP